MHKVTLQDRIFKLPHSLLGGIALMLFLAVLLRSFIGVFLQQSHIDFFAFIEIAGNLMLRNDPYDLENCVFSNWAEPPISFPGYMLFYAVPGLLVRFFPCTCSLFLILYLMLQFLVLSMICLWTGRRMGWLRNWSDLLKPGPRQLGLSFLFFIICNSAPVLMTLRHGQSTIFITGAILFVVWYQGKAPILRPVLFGIAAVLKYSMVPFLGLLFLVRKKLKLCLYGAGVFFLFALTPLLAGNNLLELYQKYIELLKTSMQKGSPNSYEISGYNMIHIGFFKLDMINMLLIAIVLVLLILVLIRTWKSNSLNDETVFFILCATMLPAYHRLYDLTVIVPFVCLITWRALLAKRTWVAVPGLLLIGYMLIPLSLLNRLAGKIGPVFEDFIYTSSSMGVDNIFPLQAVMMILVTCWAFCLCWEKGAGCRVQGAGCRGQGAGETSA